MKHITFGNVEKILKRLPAWFKQTLLCCTVFITISTSAAQPPIKKYLPLKIALPELTSTHYASKESSQLLVNFLKEYWQIWAIDNQREVNFIYMPTTEAYQSLANGSVDIVANTRYQKSHTNVLFSIPYAKWQQSFFRRIESNKNNGIQF